MDETLQRILDLLPKTKDGKFVRGCKKELADYLGLPHNIVAEWISGRNKSYFKYLYQIAEKYHVSVKWLKGNTSEKEKPATPEGDELSEEDIEIIELLRAASPSKKAALLALLKE